MNARRLTLLVATVALVLSAAPGLAHEGDHDPFEGTDEGLLLIPEDATPLGGGQAQSSAPGGWNEATGIYEMVFPHLDVAKNGYGDTFGACRSGCSRRHEGNDIFAPKMTPVVAVAAGTIGWMHNQQGGNCCAMSLNHDDGWRSYYIHLNNDTPGTDDGQGWGFAPGIAQGVHVEAGQHIAYVGDSGNAESVASHTHYELHEPTSWTPVDPHLHLDAAVRIKQPYVPSNAPGCDFNNDGYDELTVGAPGEDRTGRTDVGTVTVIPGSVGGPGASGITSWHRGTPGVDGGQKENGRFGAVIACGNFDNDAFDDLVVASPQDVVKERAEAGSISVLYGSASGIVAVGDNRWHQSRGGIKGAAQPGDAFGSALAVGDFDDDGYDDVAVGAPYEDLGENEDSGNVLVIYGSAAGIAGDAEVWKQSSPGVPGSNEGGDHFGASLTAGDFNNDGIDDLAIGVPGEDTTAGEDTGTVIMIYGSGEGLDGSSAQRWSQSSTGIVGDRGAGDEFGAALSSGDVNADSIDDLAIGVPGEGAAGAVHVVLGGGSGLKTGDDRLLGPGAPISQAVGDELGGAVAVADVNSDGFADVIAGAPGWNGAGGAIAVFYNGLEDDAHLLHQDSPGMGSSVVAGDRFGSWIGIGNFDGGRFAWVAVSVPGQDVNGVIDGGHTHLIPGGFGPLTSDGDVRWSQDTSGVPGAPQEGDGFGYVAVAGTG